MTRRKSRRVLVLILGSAVVVLAVAAAVLFRSASQTQPLQSRLISLENQEDWEAFGGTWQYAGGVMTNNSDERGAKLMTGPKSWTDYSVEADVLLLGQYGDAGLIIRASDEETGVDAYHGYMAGLRDLDNTLMMGRICSQKSDAARIRGAVVPHQVSRCRLRFRGECHSAERRDDHHRNPRPHLHPVRTFRA